MNHTVAVPQNRGVLVKTLVLVAGFDTLAKEV